MSRRLWVTIALIAVTAAGCRDRSSPGGQFVPTDDALIQRHNHAVGLMGQFDFTAAAVEFEKLVTEYPDWIEAKANWAIAALNRRAPGDTELVTKLIDEVLTADAGHLRARYCKGLLTLNEGDPAGALQHFTAVAEADGDDAYAVYYVGLCLSQQDKTGEALPWFDKAALLDPYLRSAYYGAFQAAQQLGQAEIADERFATFEKLATNPQARLVEFKYTRMGPKGEAVVVDRPAPEAEDRPPIPVWKHDEARWRVAGDVNWRTFEQDATGSTVQPRVTACDINGDGALDLFAASAAMLLDGRIGNAIVLDAGNSLTATADHPLASVTDVRAVLWGDIDNDGLTDAYFCRRGPNQLWRQTKPGEWQDVTESTGTANGTYDSVAGAMFDADHDGDLDIFVVNRDGPSELLNNNLDGTFRSIAQERDISGASSGGRAVLVADLDADRDLDIVVIRDGGGHEVWINDRLWTYHAGIGFTTFSATRIDAAAVGDINADGEVEILTLHDGKVTRWRRGNGGAWTGEPIATIATPGVAPGSNPKRIVVADFEGDGVPEPWVTNDDLWAVTGNPPGALAIQLRSGEAPLILHRQAASFTALQFTGKHDAAESMRSNASGVGVRAAVRVGSRWTVVSNLSWQSEAGQSLQPVIVGLGGAKAADFVTLWWPDGVMQTELNLAAGQSHTIAQVQRQTSSCPVLFAWDGRGYRFVTDLLGVGGIGFLLSPGEYAEPRPRESVLLPQGLPVARDGRYELRIGEPMQEACYLDGVSLTAYDLPPGWSMTVDERMATGGPEPTGQVRFYRHAATPARAVNDRGEDVTGALRDADHLAAPVGEIDRRFIGRLVGEHVLTLHFGEPLNSLDRPGDPMLIIDGWVEYPYAQTMFAAWQAKADYRAPSLEAQGEDGQWVTVYEQFGYPAGFPRQMSLPVPREKLPAGTRVLRLRTNQEVYFDRIAAAWAEPCDEAVRRELPMTGANVSEAGFALRTTGPQRLPHYDYDRRAPLWDAPFQRGFYTRFGEANELVRRADSAVAIIGPGEEVAVTFDAAPTRAAPPTGWTRRFVLQADGWCKDMDLYTRDGQTVAPLPARRDATEGELRQRDELHRRYNTRYRFGG